MAIQSSLSGLRLGTANNLVLDAGALYVNANIALLLDETTPAGLAFEVAIDPLNGWEDPNGVLVYPRKLGATREGTRVSIEKEERQVEADGRRTMIKGFQRVNMISPKITTSLLEFGDFETLKIALGSTTVTEHTNFNEARPYLYPRDEDYIGNIMLAATINGRFAPGGEDMPLIIVLENVRVNAIQEQAFTDNNESVLPVELVGHALAEDAFTIPIRYIFPKDVDEIGYY